MSFEAWYQNLDETRKRELCRLFYQASALCFPSAEPAAPPTKGKQGEEEIYRMLTHRYLVEDTSSQPRSGDLWIYFNSQPVLVEIKNYSRLVPQREVDKFYRDLRYQQPAAGIIISLGTKFTGINRYFTLRMVDSIPVVMVVSRDPDLICLVLDWLQESLLELPQLVNQSTTLSQVDLHLNQLQDLQDRAHQARLHLEQHQQQCFQSFLQAQDAFRSLQTQMEHLRQQFQQSIRQSTQHRTALPAGTTSEQAAVLVAEWRKKFNCRIPAEFQEFLPQLLQDHSSLTYSGTHQVHLDHWILTFRNGLWVGRALRDLPAARQTQLLSLEQHLHIRDGIAHVKFLKKTRSQIESLLL